MKDKESIEKEPIEEKRKPKMVMVRSKLDRHFDLHIGRETISFDAHEEKKIPAILLLHEKWKRVQKHFCVKGEVNAK